MKKIYALIAATGLVLSAASFASAVEDTLEGGATVTDSILVKASVQKYAALTNLAQATQVDADGSAGSVMSGTATFNVESNCDVSVSISDNALTNADNESITTTWKLDDNGLSVEQDYTPNSAVPHTAEFSAKLGAISAQAAGDYSANLVVTVAAIN